VSQSGTSVLRPSASPGDPPIVSVVIPVYNRPVQACRAVASVLAQTFQNFEIIVVDDGSTDASLVALKRLTDSRIVVLEQGRNRGASAARNTGIDASTAPFVAFLDSDDEWLPTKLERQLHVFEQRDMQLALVYTGTERIDDDGYVTRYIPPPCTNLARRLLIKNVIGETSVGMVRRGALKAVGGFDESLRAFQDVDLWLRLCRRFDAEAVPEALVRVEKAAGAGRISTNVVSGLNGRDQFRRKHHEEFVFFGVLHFHLRESGWWSLRVARNPRLARRYFREAIVARPLAPLSYVLLLMACVPTACLDALAWCRHACVGVVKLGLGRRAASR